MTDECPRSKPDTLMKSALDQVLMRKSPYRSRPIEAYVEISTREQTIDTLEGPVVCRPGDAIVTGVKGERYPVPANKFHEKYQLVQGQEAATSGRYTKRIKDVEAAQLYEPLNVQLPGGRGELNGKPGDWCIWYDKNDSNNRAIVASDIFPKLYESKAVCVYVELGRDLSAVDKKSALLVVHALHVALSNTSIVFTEETHNKPSDQPIWFRIVKQVADGKSIIPSVIELSVDSVMSDGSAGLIALVSQAAREESKWDFSLRKFAKAAIPRGKKAEENSSERVVAWQLAAVENFNKNLKSNWDKPFPHHFIEKRDEPNEPTGLKKVYRIGAIADQLATEHQEKWQRLVFATTKEIAKEPMAKRLLSVPHTLITLGLLAAVMLAAFSELGGTCDRSDPWGFEFCTSGAWEHWARPIFFFAYLAALVFAWLRYAKAKTEQWEVRHQDFRLLAECIRVLHVRTLLGKPACVASDLPLAEPTDSGWVRLALRSIFFDARQAGLQTTSDAPTKVAQALTSFVKPQVEYHENTLLTRREHAIDRLSKVSRFGFKFFVIVLAIVFTNVVVEAFLHHAFLSKMMDHVALISIVLGLGSWGGMRKVIDSFGLEQELQRGRLVLSYLAKAEKAGTNDAILEAANYFLDDQAHWHALHRSKPIEAATGG